jgi:hypothetical protein
MDLKRDILYNKYFIAFVILMAIDTIITIVGSLYVSTFREANPLFSIFLGEPLIFGISIVFFKMMGIIFVVLCMLYLDHDNDVRVKWFVNNIPRLSCYFMCFTLSLLIVSNLIYVFK